jgi:hypothetical protein
MSIQFAAILDLLADGLATAPAHRVSGIIGSLPQGVMAIIALMHFELHV